nr:DUF4365 and DUF1817 domain-containing protein [Oceanococcus sp. HetDA_MAG_MS8]
MGKGFPTYSSAARSGDRGVDLVSRVINEHFGWLFRRNHQEHDFGIDAQVDVVLEDGLVTGQMLALQIKHGASFFREKNQWGYVFRGEQKHFNYLANYPTPVLIVICHPKSGDCYWVKFDPSATARAGGNWKITIPSSNKLADSKGQLMALLPEPADYLSAIEAYWAMNDVLVDHGHFLYIIGRDEIEALDASEVREFFDRLRSSPEIAAHCQGKVELAFHGFDDDPRELFEIPEMRSFVPVLSVTLPELFFFAYTGERASTLKVFAMCLTQVTVTSRVPNEKNQLPVEVETRAIGAFLERHFPGLNEMTEWLSMPVEENKRISFEVMKALGMRGPDDA